MRSARERRRERRALRRQMTTLTLGAFDLQQAMRDLWRRFGEMFADVWSLVAVTEVMES